MTFGKELLQQKMFVLCNNGSCLSFKGLFCEDQSEQNICLFLFINKKKRYNLELKQS